MKSKILELFGLAAKDKSPEEIARMAQDAASVMDEGTPAEPEKKEPEKDGGKEEPAKDGGLFENIDDAALDGLLEKLMARKAAKEAAEKEADGDPLEATIRQLTGGEAEVQPGGGSGYGEEAHVVPAEEMDKGSDCGGMDKAIAASILKAMRPTVAAIRDEKQREAVSGALIKCVTAQDSASDIAKIMQAAQKNAQHAADNKPQADLDKIQALYDARNPHKNKKED